jgi:CBS domain-containing protein
MTVRDIMTRSPITVQEDTSLEDVARTLLDHRIGCVPVVSEQGKLVGIVTESDFTAKERGIPFSTFRAPNVLGEWLPDTGIERIYQAARTREARDIMSCPVVTVSEGDPIEKAVQLMMRYDINRIPVVRDGVPTGIVARHDVLRLMMPQ